MKLLNSLLLLASVIASVYAGGRDDYEITHYGCPDECDTQEHNSCHFDSLPSHFAALSTKLSGYHSYCGSYAIYMMSDGSSTKLGKATIVDSCRSCSRYHLDLSTSAYNDVHKGSDKVIWGIYSKSGSKLAGPFYGSVSGAANKVGMSSDSFVSAFNANAKKLASSSSHSLSFSSSSKDKDTTTTTTTARTTARTTATKTVTTTKTLNAKTTTTTTKTLPTTRPAKKVPTEKNPAKNEQKTVNKAVNENKEENNNTAIGLIALGGGCLGAAGLGLVLLKKKNPNTYESMKQKFPEAFTNVKRGLTRSATSLKRKVTKKNPKQEVEVSAEEV